MSATKYTPGPWTAHQWSYDEGAVSGWSISVGEHSLPLSDLETNDPEEVEANARLIAASPDLLEALTLLTIKTDELLKHLQSTGRLRPCFNLPALESARVALAKAEVMSPPSICETCHGAGRIEVGEFGGDCAAMHNGGRMPDAPGMASCDDCQGAGGVA